MSRSATSRVHCCTSSRKSRPRSTTSRSRMRSRACTPASPNSTSSAIRSRSATGRSSRPQALTRSRHRRRPRRTLPGQSFLPASRSSSRSHASLSAIFDSAARHRLVPARLAHPVRQVRLAGRIRIRLVVRVTVGVTVAEFLHQLGRRVAQMHGHLARLVLFHERHRLVERVVARVALRRARDRSPPARARAFRRAEALVGFAASFATCSARGSARPMSSHAIRTIRRARYFGSAPPSIIRQNQYSARPGSNRAPTCAAPRSGRRSCRRPCRSAVRSASSRC